MRGDDADVAKKWEPGRKNAAPEKEYRKSEHVRSRPGNERDTAERSYVGRYRNDEMRRHLKAVRQRVKDRISLQQPVAEGLGRQAANFNPGRVTQRFGFSSHAKQSEVVFNPKRIPSAIRKVIHDDIREVLARSAHGDEAEWTHAPQIEQPREQMAKLARGKSRSPERDSFGPLSGDDLWSRPNRPEARDRASCAAAHEGKESKRAAATGKLISSFFSPQQSTFLTKSQREDLAAGKTAIFLFPVDTPVVEIADRLLSALPHITLRNDSPATYSSVLCGMLADAHAAAARRPTEDDEGNTANNSLSRDPTFRNEDVLRSFYERTAPFAVSSPGPDTSAQARDFEQIFVNYATSEPVSEADSLLRFHDGQLAPDCHEESFPRSQANASFRPAFDSVAGSSNGCNVGGPSSSTSSHRTALSSADITFPVFTPLQSSRSPKPDSVDDAMLGLFGSEQGSLEYKPRRFFQSTGMLGRSSDGSSISRSYASVDATFASSRKQPFFSPGTTLTDFDFLLNTEDSSPVGPQNTTVAPGPFVFDF